jgi:lipid-A-disaccharide synthase
LLRHGDLIPVRAFFLSVEFSTVKALARRGFMSRIVTVAATQMACSWDLEANLETAEKLVREAAAAWPAAPILVEDIADKHDAFAAAAENGAGLIKSGTSSLEMAVAGVPHIVAYRVNPITAAIARRLVKVPHASLVNLLCAREVVPEYIQETCTPQELATALLPLLQNPASITAQRQGFAETLAKLRAPEGSPSDAAAAAVLAALP